MPNQPDRKGSDMRFRPRRRERSRYGMVETALNRMRKEGITEFELTDVAKRIKQLQASSIKGIMHFTIGIEYKRANRMWYFTGEEVRVDAG